MLDRLDKKAESETDEMRLCPFIRVPVRGTKEARLLDIGVVYPARPVSTDILEGGARLLSV